MSIKKIILCAMAVASFGWSTASAQQVPTNIVENIIQDHILNDNSNLSREEANYLSQAVIYYSYNYGVDPLVVTSLISTESHFHQSSISSAGAIGLGQIMPDTAVALGVNPYDEKENIEGACSYLSTQIKNFSYSPTPVEFALAAYNAGPQAVKNYGGIPPYQETQNYVVKVKNTYFSLYDKLMGLLGSNISYPSTYQKTPKYEVENTTQYLSATQDNSVDVSVSGEDDFEY